MKIRPSSLLLLAPVAFLCSCATTSLENTWKAPQAHGPLGKIAVLAVEDDGMVRQVFENRFVADLVANGARAMPTFNHFALTELKQDKRAAAELLHSKGVETIAIMRLTSKSMSFREVQASPERYAATITDFQSWGWYDYYNVAFMNMTTTYGSMKERVFIETTLYNLKTEKPFWSALTRTTVGDGTDRLAEIGVISTKVIEAMRKDGMIQ